MTRKTSSSCSWLLIVAGKILSQISTYVIRQRKGIWPLVFCCNDLWISKRIENHPLVFFVNINHFFLVLGISLESFFVNRKKMLPTLHPHVQIVWFYSSASAAAIFNKRRKGKWSKLNITTCVLPRIRNVRRKKNSTPKKVFFSTRTDFH